MDVYNDPAPLVVKLLHDEATETLSVNRSKFLRDGRVVRVGEDDVLELRFTPTDDFGAPMASMIGQTVRFYIDTPRLPLDADDAALSASPSGPFRTGQNVPLQQSVDVTVDNNVVAKAYFQSARSSSEAFLQDRVRVMWPIV
jgi:hypothetical protein